MNIYWCPKLIEWPDSAYDGTVCVVQTFIVLKPYKPTQAIIISPRPKSYPSFAEMASSTVAQFNSWDVSHDGDENGAIWSTGQSSQCTELPRNPFLQSWRNKKDPEGGSPDISLICRLFIFYTENLFCYQFLDSTTTEIWPMAAKKVPRCSTTAWLIKTVVVVYVSAFPNYWFTIIVV